MDYAKFTKQGKLIKGIKLELVPQGNTRDAISEYKIVEADQQLADMVKEVVMAGNEFYKDFIKQIVGHMDGADWQAYGEAVENKATEQKTYDEAVKSISASIKNAILDTAELYGCEFPYKSRVMGTSEPLKPLKAPYMARNPVKWGFFRLKGQEIPLKI